ncbi:MAG: anaerobic ribonucleoside-triphosphate reductase activating protein [Anaerolineae bacterium]|nr:anaerobic ribonucleoside-triphosphate reductase activating protein [Anaerolineae bacterium]
MQIRGWVRTSLIDYPGKIATVLFTSGCNFRCPYCQNSELVLHPESLPEIDPAEIFQFLTRRRGLIDGVVITGGEPTLQKGLEDFLRKAKELGPSTALRTGLAAKLDTNGYHPQVIRDLLEQRLLDYVAMDIKAPLAKYPLAAGVPVDVQRIEESVRLILSSGTDHEFRTTVVPGIVAPEDVEEMARLIAGAEKYILQQFRPQETLDPRFREVIPYPAQTLLEMAQAAERWVGEVEVRGL